MTSPRLLLYSTDHCALCDEALDMLLSMPELAGLSLEVVDICDDDELIAEFGEKLPVLAILAANDARRAFLCWPFSTFEVSGQLTQVE